MNKLNLRILIINYTGKQNLSRYTSGVTKLNKRFIKTKFNLFFLFKYFVQLVSIVLPLIFVVVISFIFYFYFFVEHIIMISNSNNRLKKNIIKKVAKNNIKKNISISIRRKIQIRKRMKRSNRFFNIKIKKKRHQYIRIIK